MTIEPLDQYPSVVDVECVCLAPGCGAEFTVPTVYLEKNRPVGTPPDRCPSCAAAERVQQQARAVRIEREERARETAASQKRVLEALEEMGANPWVYNQYTLDTLDAWPGREAALAATREWTDAVLATVDRYAPVRGLYLVGPTGTLKTELAHCALKRLVEAGLQPGTELVYDDALSLIERIQGTYGSDERTWDLLEARVRAKVWVLDDFGTEKPSPDVVRKLTLIFNRREGRPNLVTSNLHPRNLTERNEEFFRLLSRFGTQRYRIVPCEGSDGRFRAAAEVS
jgi:DNA replication protein DnaC